MVKLKEKVVDKKYGKGVITTIFESGRFQVTFKGRYFPVLYEKNLVRDSKIPKLTIIKEKSSNYVDVNKLFERLDKVDARSIKVYHVKELFKNSDLSYTYSQRIIQNTIDNVHKGRDFGEDYLISLGSKMHRSLQKNCPKIRNFSLLPLSFDQNYVNYIYLANKEKEDELYNNMEVIIPLIDSPLNSWFDVETNSFNMEAFNYSEYQAVDLKDYQKVDKDSLDEDLLKKVTKILSLYKTNILDIYEKDNFFIISGGEINIFVGSIKIYLNFKDGKPTNIIKSNFSNSKFTYEICKETALKYDNKKQFRENNMSCYKHICLKGWVDDLCSHMSNGSQWNKQRARAETLKYNSLDKFRVESPKCFTWCKSNGYFDEFTEHMKTYHEIRVEEVTISALNYKTRTEFRVKNKVNYVYALRYKLLDNICSHMIRKSKYNYKDVKNLFLSCRSKKEIYTKSLGSYEWARRNGFLDEFLKLI